MDTELKTHRLTTQIVIGAPASSTRHAVNLGEGTLVELCQRVDRLSRVGLIDNFTVFRVEGESPAADTILTMWIDMAVANLERLNGVQETSSPEAV